jgi:hypothetical protein
MNKLLALFFILICPVCLNKSFGQSGEALDTIIKVEGKVMPVDVIKVTSSYVRFKIPGDDELYTMSRKDIHKVIYKNGRIEDYNALVAIDIDNGSWQSVWITDNKEDVLSLYKRGVASVSVQPSSRSVKASKKSAIMKLQKKAAAMQGSVVLITKQQTTGGYGEFQGYDMEGIVYGEKPLDDDEARENNQ